MITTYPYSFKCVFQPSVFKEVKIGGIKDLDLDIVFNIKYNNKQDSIFLLYIIIFSLVIRNLKPLDPNRRCYRSIGGVLVERTVKEVLPLIEKNMAMINKWIEQRTLKLKEKEAECDEFRLRYNIGLGKPLADNNESKEEDKKSTGILA